MKADLQRAIGLGGNPSPLTDPKLVTYINLKLAALGCPTLDTADAAEFHDLTESLLARHRETERLLSDYQAPVDWRIQQFLDEYLHETGVAVRLPHQTFVLDRHGVARALSLPPDRDEFRSDIVSSYRVRQGVLHNPAKDKRTTAGVFHVAEGGLPIPDDKKAVPAHTFARMLDFALKPPQALKRLPFTATQPQPAECFVSLLLRPLVCPAVPGFCAEKTMEIRFFAPGNLVSNLDFVESIFGNAGDPYLPVNDAALDVEHWTGHTGCVILAPHLITVTKKDAGLPHFDQATERQRRDGMCWRTEDERYNDGSAFKLTARDESGVIVTLIADNYFGYCKKEVKTQISFAANLFGLCEEEHAGGALVFPSYDLGEEFAGGVHVQQRGHSFEDAAEQFKDVMELKPEGYAVDRKYADILYVPEDASFDLRTQAVTWTNAAGAQQLKLLAGHTYVRPSGYKVRMEKPGSRAWRLVGTRGEGTFCHKPCTVSGGGKSEISKSLSDAILQGPVFVADFRKDFDQVAGLLARDYSQRFRDPARNGTDTRPILARDRSLGSVIKLLTPSPKDYSDEFNAWLEGIPQYVKELVFVVKRFHKPEWGGAWREHFGVDVVNGVPGNELKCDDRKLVTSYLRVGFDADGAWRVFSLRKDFHPALKLQQEDDISASTVVPAAVVKRDSAPSPAPAGAEAAAGATAFLTRASLAADAGTGRSLKFVQNCEYRLFQRPDDAVHRGYDKQTENDFAQPGNFFSNYQPLTRADAQRELEDSINFVKFTPPMAGLIRAAAKETGRPRFFVSSAQPRLVDGRMTKNPRYLQNRQDLVHPREFHLAEMATRLFRRVPTGEPLHRPVNAVLPGRRNNPPEPGVRPLCVFNPIHHLELPELFIEFIASMTGKSPSTTGAGSEGALTKGPFNALHPVIDLNAALVSYILTGDGAFVTCAGHVGPNVRVDHDISLLVPELWCRMGPEERDPEFLKREGYLERCEDLDFNGRRVLASRLGWRITGRFVRHYFGRVFNYQHSVFTDEMLRPEQQDLAVFADGVDNIVSTARRVAEHYFADGGIELACPPLRALLHIMRDGRHEGRDLGHPAIRALFTRESLLASDWYLERLKAKQAADEKFWQRRVKNLEAFLARPNTRGVATQLNIRDRLDTAWAELRRAQSPGHLASLRGTLGVQARLRP
jgi:phosphoenolpyruvate carboxykinase (diphosphate)